MVTSTYERSREATLPIRRGITVVFPSGWTDPQCAAWVLDQGLPQPQPQPQPGDVWSQNVAACPSLAKVESSPRVPAFVHDIADKAKRYLLSERQRAAVTSAVEQAESPTKPIETGRRLVEGKVVKLKWESRNSGYGYRVRTTQALKALVQCDGYRLYGTVPSAIVHSISVGDTLRVEAEVVQKEPGFGFFSRPRVK